MFGRVIEGITIIEGLSRIKTSTNDRPLRNIVVKDCGLASTESVSFYANEMSRLENYL